MSTSGMLCVAPPTRCVQAGPSTRTTSFSTAPMTLLVGGGGTLLVEDFLPKIREIHPRRGRARFQRLRVHVSVYDRPTKRNQTK